METTHDNHQQHPLLDIVASISDEFDKASTFNPTFVPTTDKATAMRQLSTVITRAQGLLLSVMAASGDVADETGAKRVGDWYATATRHDHRPSTGLDRLARSLDTHHAHLHTAVLDGRVNLDQAVVIVHTLDELPSEVPSEIREQAELHLIGLADDFAPTQLRRLARKVLEVVAPEISEEAERRALDREEQLADVLPAHGGTATTVTVHLNLDQLTASLEQSGIATLDTGDTISASQARRLACQAKILPAVLGTKSEILDLGRTRRLHTAAQRKAIRIQQTQCQTDGCTVPAAWCETHHRHAWSAGGKTDLDNAALLCCHHHHRAHDTRYLTKQLPNGDYRFTRRT